MVGTSPCSELAAALGAEPEKLLEEADFLEKKGIFMTEFERDGFGGELLLLLLLVGDMALAR